MPENTDKYLCPFCVSTWDCDGPHIEEKYSENFNERMYYMREDLALLAKEMIQDFAKTNGHDLTSLEQAIYEKLINRSF
jgi:hypothetical protein